MDIQFKNIVEIKPYSNNPRTKRSIDKVAQSIKEFGFQQPLVIDKKNIIIVGHTRYEAAKLLELKKVPVIIANISQEKAKAYRIADNKTNEYSEWDYDLLHIELEELSKIQYDLKNLGFGEQELESIISWDSSEKKWLDYEKEWQDMPEYKHDDLRPYKSLIVHFLSEKDVEDFFKLIQQDHTEKTKFIYYPFIGKKILKDKGYAVDESNT